MAVDPCVIVDTLAALQGDLLKSINRKFAALQSLAFLLEQLGDLSSFIPNLTGLPPITQIDLTTYLRLQGACPYLKLPNATATLNQLQVAVVAAYNNLFKKLLKHPYNRLGDIQRQMAAFQAKITMPLAQAGDFLVCLQAVCGAGATVVDQLKALTNSDVGKEIAIYADNYAKNAGSVLSTTGSQKLGQVRAAQDQLIILGADVGKDYASAKAAIGK